MTEWQKLWDSLPETRLWRAYIPSYFLAKIKAVGDKLLSGLQHWRKLENEKHRKLEAIRKLVEDMENGDGSKNMFKPTHSTLRTDIWVKAFREVLEPSIDSDTLRTKEK